MVIPTEDLPPGFTPFFRGERSRSHGTGGVGLGLTLAQRVVEAHGGTLEASSCVGHGTSFCVLLPAASRSSPSTQPDTEQPLSRAQSALARRIIGFSG